MRFLRDATYVSYSEAFTGGEEDYPVVIIFEHLAYKRRRKEGHNLCIIGGEIRIIGQPDDVIDKFAPNMLRLGIQELFGRGSKGNAHSFEPIFPFNLLQR